eukprot:9484451-Pyramimonas_sp.AAC.1
MRHPADSRASTSAHPALCTCECQAPHATLLRILGAPSNVFARALRLRSMPSFGPTSHLVRLRAQAPAA